MLIRLIILALVFGGIGFAVWRMLGPRRLRVPFIWRSVAGRHPDVKRALEIRTAIATLLLDEPDAKFDPVMSEVDEVIETLVRLARARDASGARPSETEAMALDELDALLGQMRQEGEAETDDVLDRLRSRLAERAGDLRQTLAARKEIGD